MIQYSNLQLATIITIPIISIILIWTIAIFHKNRKKWGPYDIPIVSLLVLSLIRNICVISYVLIITLNETSFNIEYCSIFVWLFNSIHTFQASVLTTIAVIGLFSSKLNRKKQNLRQFLTTTHIVYHLFCLTTLCACVGVAAILAKTNDTKGLFKSVTVFTNNPCSILPFELDIKFNVFILVLHIFLGIISFGSFILICYNYYKTRTNSFDYLKKSNSDLSNLSLGGLTLGTDSRNYFDTYTIQRNVNNAENIYEGQNILSAQNSSGYAQSGNNPGSHGVWSSDGMSNISTTVSSTNSRRPCITKKQFETIEDWNRTGLETIHPVLIVCYLFYHIPLIVLCIYPNLIAPYPVSAVALWLGLLQDLLIPVGLGIVDSRFCKWVTNVYRCSGALKEEKLPHVGLDGKFRPFGTSQPQSLEVQSQDRTMRNFQTIEHRFPANNGTLYTTIDGNNRMPLIHNYRRHKDQKDSKMVQDHLKSSSNVSLYHSSHLKRPQEYTEKSVLEKVPKCKTCETDQCPSHSNLHHLSPEYINKKLNYLHQNNENIFSKNILSKKSNSNLNISRLSLDNLDSLNEFIVEEVKPQKKENKVLNNNLNRFTPARLSRSHDSIHDIKNKEIENKKIDYYKKPEFKTIPKMQEVCPTSLTIDYFTDSEDEYMSDLNINDKENKIFVNYDSGSSCNSITTEANGDFEFFNNKEPVTQQNNQSNSKTYQMKRNNSFLSSPNHFYNFDLQKSNNDNEYFLVKQHPIMSSFKPHEYKEYKQLLNKNDSICNNNEIKNFRIRRSNSKRSLENFQAYIEHDESKFSEQDDILNKKFQRSNSYMTLEDRRKNIQKINKLLRSDSQKVDCMTNYVEDSRAKNCNKNNFKPRIKSVEYLPNSSTIYIEDCSQLRNNFNNFNGDNKYVGSVPDLKKVFISEYI